MPRHFIIGDIHGCGAELRELLDKAGLGTGDRVVALGDFLDRGPESVAVFEALRGLSAICLLGNHERKHLRSARGEIPAALSQVITRQQMGEDLYATAIAFLEDLPTYLELPEALIVHGFFEPGLTVRRQRETVLVGTLSGEHYLERHYPSPWYAQYRGKKPLIVGHHDYQKNGEPLVYHDRVYGIDTGCCYGGALTGLLLPEFRFVSVRSRGNHWEAARRAWDGRQGATGGGVATST